MKRTPEFKHTQRVRIQSALHEIAFYLELAAAAHNRVLEGFYRSAAGQMRSMRVLESLTLEVYLEGVEEHFAIAGAIRQHDAPLAAQRRQEHLKKDYSAYL